MSKSMIRMKRAALCMLHVFPVNRNKIFFSAYEGKQFACNPKALFLYMKKRGMLEGMHVVWEYNGKSTAFAKRNVTSCRHNSLSYFYHIMTSRFVITNSGVTASVPLRKEQTCVNTWHAGGAFKKFGADISGEMNGTDVYALKVAAEQTDYFVSSNTLFSENVARTLMLGREKILDIGLPRNDVFFNPAKLQKIRSKVREKYGVKEEDYLVLYAPTFRGNSGEDRLQTRDSVDRDLEKAIREKTGKKPVFLLRRHYYHHEEETYSSYINVSAYPDMQDLLAAADMLITDYSSAMWDFALTGKPCLLYVPDLGEYLSQRGFYTEPETWPGILCESVSALSQAVRSFDPEQYQMKLDAYFTLTGSCETGEGCQKLCETLFQ